MQTPGSVTSRTSMVDSATARMSSAKTSLNLEKVNKNLIQLRNEFRADIRDRAKFEEKRAKLLKKEESSLTGLRAATFNLRTIIGAASGASALRQFSQGNISGGLQETGVAVAAFIPEIIDITSKIVVGGLATKGLLGGGGVGGGMPKGKAGLLALPLLALAPLLMGAGNKNNNAPTAEFRREQGVRRTRKNIISSGDTDRFGMQLDRFERILDSMGGDPKQKRNINLPLLNEGQIGSDEDGRDEDGRDEEGRDKDGKKNIQNQIVDFLSLLDPFKGTMGLFKSDEAKMQESKDDFAIFGTIFDGIKNLFRPAEAKAGTLDEFIKDGGVLPNQNESKVNSGNISNTLKMSNDGQIDFKSILGSKKGEEMESMMINFLGVMKNEFIPMTDDDKLASIANSFTSKSLTPITKINLDNAPESIQNTFIPILQEGGLPSYQDDGATEETDSGVSDPSVDVEFRGSVDKFVNRLLLNINR